MILISFNINGIRANNNKNKEDNENFSFRY